MGATNHCIVFLLIKTIAILPLMVWTPFVPHFVAWIDFIITVIVTCLAYSKLGNSKWHFSSSMSFVTPIPVLLQLRKRTSLSLPRMVLSSMMKSVSVSWVTKMENMFQTRILATCDLSTFVVLSIFIWASIDLNLRPSLDLPCWYWVAIEHCVGNS